MTAPTDGTTLLTTTGPGIRLKLALTFSLVIMLVMLLSVLLATRRERAIGLERARLNGLTLGTTIRLGMGEDIVRANYQGLDFFLRRFAVNNRALVEYCFILNPQGKVISSTEADQTGKFVTDPWSLDAAGVGEIAIRRALFRGRPVYDAAVPVNLGGLSWGVIRMGFSLAHEQESVRRFLWYNLSLGLLFILAGIGIAFSLSASFLAPITDLLAATERVGQGDFQARTRITTRDEFEQLGTSFNRMTRELAKKARMRKYLSQAAWEEIEAGTGEVIRGGRREEVAVLFSDLKGFTTFSERHQPEEVVDYLNRFFDHMVQGIADSGGIIDKFIGDCIMGVFLPRQESRWPPEIRAIHAALRMKRNLAEFNLGQAQLGLEEFQTGIGINGGPVVLGNVGAATRLEFTVLGDTVNLAARLEGESRGGTHTQTFLTGPVRRRVERFVDCRLVETKKVKGKTEPVEIYEVTGLTGIPSLRERFGGAPPDEKVEIIQLCGLSRHPEGREFLADLAGNPVTDPPLRTEAIRALGGFMILGDTHARRFLEGLLRTEVDEVLLGSTVSSLALARDREMVPLFRDLAGHAVPRVRANAIEALLALGDPGTRDLLVRLVADHHPRVCANAWLGLWTLGDPEVLPGILGLLEASEATRRAAGAYTVGILAATRRFRSLFGPHPAQGTSPQAAPQGSSPAAPPDPAAAAGTGQGLPESGSPAVRPAGTPGSREMAERLGHCLRAMLRAGDPSERLQAVRSLALIGDARAAPDLAELLSRETDPQVRMELEEATRKLRSDSRPTPALPS